MWIAEKIPKLWRKVQPFASNVSTNTARDATLHSVLFDLTPMPFNVKLCFVIRDDLKTIYGKTCVYAVMDRLSRICCFEHESSGT